ncbi:MAG: hypothetical protein OZ913_00785 [Ignavibacteriaceae bacterium]|jgi:hypothetical protein|nr:MAG: hypothetical protein UZ04_CHB001001406 [Chlorobi bacterium OLB4]MBW7855534.1 hypothetical protein [Ignavibacteria bacterium]MEB2328823.1 hypothetical protein [Ignavibacteriaceae bacterium]OQY77121.1 MAG: hypothetical protein B6D43_08400 [Ignavibacteriales bacterium UTCHB1]
MKLTILTLTIFLFVTSVFPQEIEKSIYTDTKLELKKVFVQEFENKLALNNSFENNLRSVDNSKEKSPVIAGVLSAVIPGTGEIYAGNYLKGAIFLGVEAGLWTMHFIKINSGDSKTEEYQNYANNNWDVYKYAAWLKNNNFSGAEVIDLTSDKETLRLQVNQVESLNFSHTLPPYGAQQYYEVIGKYQNFVAGWSQADASIINNNPNSPNYYFNYKIQQVADYMQSRQDANDLYQFADNMIMLSIINRVLSTADAIWTVSLFNSNLEVKTSARLKNTYLFKEGRNIVTPFANIQISGF